MNTPLVFENVVPSLDPRLSASERLLEYLIQGNYEHTATTGDIRQACQLAKSTFKFVMDTLISDGKVEKIGYGLYQLKR
ncbi:hypothetical protein F4Z98_03380 [Candidatus Poribacteria bacterium]|nr:hypothetical protein [Candidatus Poribacteria bacterium]MYA99405.1 hypothetical protein [Candidatus Poribacteria bacterium]